MTTEHQNVIAYNLNLTAEWMDELMEVIKGRGAPEKDLKPFRTLKGTMTAAVAEISRLDALLHEQNVKNLEKGLNND